MRIDNRRVRVKRAARQHESDVPFKRRVATCTAALLLGAAGIGCAPVEASDTEGEQPGTATQGIESDEWKNFAREAYPHLWPFALADEPAVCANIASGAAQVSIIAARNPSDKKYYLKRTVRWTDTDWQLFDGKAFASPPACTHVPAFTNGMPNPNPFILAGKGTSPDSRIYAFEGTAGDPLLNPIPKPSPSPGPWVQLGSTTYTNAGDGYPALSTNGSRVVLTFRAYDSAASKQRIYTHTRASTSGSSWIGRFTAPDLPDGAVAAGTPTIAYLKDAANTVQRNRFVILVRTTAGGMYWILYTAHTSTGSMNTWGHLVGSTRVYWQRVFVNVTVESDPVVEWDPTDRLLTLYYRTTDIRHRDDAGNFKVRVINTSVSDLSFLGGGPYAFIDPTDHSDLIQKGAPRVAVGAGVEHGRRTVLIRGRIESDGSDVILLTEDHSALGPPP